MNVSVVIVALFSVATGVALLARHIKLPYTVALVVAGLVLGSAHALEVPHLTQELLYTVFLPGLLFEAAFHLQFKKFWQNKITVVSLAVPALMVAIGFTAALLFVVVNALHVVDHYSVAEAVVFASLIAATDPIAVVALFKSLGAPKRLAVLVESESLLNDGTSIVVFTLILSFVLGKPLSVPSATYEFMRVVGMGVLVGGTVGLITSWFIHKIDDAMLEITLTTIAAYGSFIAAEHFHVSGVIATVTAGMITGSHAARTGMSASTRVAVAAFWEYLAFALNSLVFLLIGFAVHLHDLIAAWKPILVAYAAVTIGRAAVIHLVAFVLRRTRERISAAWASVLAWGGLRGALSMVLVLALPATVPHRDLVVSMTFGVVVLSILVQGLTMGPLLRRLGLVQESGAHAEYERLRADAKAGRAALRELDRLNHDRGLAAEVTKDLHALYEGRVRASEDAIAGLRATAQSLVGDERVATYRRLLLAEKAALLHAHRSGELGAESFERLAADVDARIVELEATGDAGIEEDVEDDGPPKGDALTDAPEGAADEPEGGAKDGEDETGAEA